MSSARRSSSNSARGTTFPASTADRDVAAELEARLTLDEGDDFSLVQPPSVVSSLEHLSARSVRPGGEFLTSPPASRAASLPGSVGRGGVAGSFLETPRGSGSPQQAVYINDSIASTLCLGAIGSSGRFCVAVKARGLSHCGTVAHARTKFSVTSDTFYTPAGSLLGKASAKRSPSIARADIPRAMLPLFETGLMSTVRWEALFNEAITKGPSTPSRSPTERRSSPINEEHRDGQVGEDMSLGSMPTTISFVEMDAVYDGESAHPIWTTLVDETINPADWSAAAREQRAALERLGGMVGSLFTTVPSVVDKLNSRFRPVVSKHSRDLASL
jgi:hypothetical protein